MKKDLIKIVMVTFSLVEIFLFRIIASFNYSSYLSWILIIANIIYIGFFLLYGRKCEDKKYNMIIFLSFIVRNIVLFLDINGMTVGFTGDDTERFYLSAIGHSTFVHNYSTLLKVFVNIVGDSRIVLQYINVLFSLFSMIFIKKILKMICNNHRKIMTCLIIFSFAPANILLTCSLLRESIMIFLNILSLYHFIIWYKESKVLNFILSCLFVFFSAWLHSGMLVLIPSYAISYIVYNYKLKKICFTRNTAYSLVFVVLLTVLLYFAFGSTVTSYFSKIQSVESLTIRTVVGNTDYLNFINNVNSVLLLILYTPLKIIYFYFSPMIWDCYSISTLLVFLFSSSIYMFLTYCIFKNKKIDKTLFILLIIGYVGLSIIYAWGTSNAGTAMRHREKILPLLIIIFSLTKTKWGKEI